MAAASLLQRFRFAAGTLCLLAAVIHGEIRYNVIDLSHNIDTLSRAIALNNHNQVAGYSLVPSTDGVTWLRRGFVYRDGARIELSPALAGKECLALDLNDAGAVVGATYLSDSAPEPHRIHHACRWVDGQIEDLGTFGGIRSMAYAINNRGQIAGYYSVHEWETHRDILFVCDGDSVRTLSFPESWPPSYNDHIIARVLGEDVDVAEYPANYTRLFSMDMNDYGDVVADFCSNQGENYSVLWTADTVLRLDDRVSSSDLAFGPWHIYNDGSVAGILLKREVRSGVPRATYPAIWVGDTAVRLPYNDYRTMNYAAGWTPAGAPIGYIGDIDNGDTTAMAVIWEHEEALLLNSFIDSTLGWNIRYCHSINDSGFIAGSGTIDGKLRALLLAPRPPAVVLPTDGRITVTLTKASATLVSDVHMVEPDSILLIANNLINVGTTVDTIYRLGTELRFAIDVHGPDSVYRHYSDSKYAKVSTVSDTQWTIHFEDLPEERADWDYDDVVIEVTLSTLPTEAAEGPIVGRLLPATRRESVALYDLLGRRRMLMNPVENSGAVANGAFITVDTKNRPAMFVKPR
ncbi:MAG: hypothetical protein GF331_06985 [Chitinivibrionales bacterium]|nr:hypothetical protein [Chitinivibrionales bacterium]